MPILNVLLSGTADEQKTQQVAHMLANCTSQILRKNWEVILRKNTSPVLMSKSRSPTRRTLGLRRPPSFRQCMTGS